MMACRPPGSVRFLDTRKTDLASEADFIWYDMKIGRGSEKAHFVEFDPKNPSLELQAETKSGKVYGMQGVSANGCLCGQARKPGHCHQRRCL